MKPARPIVWTIAGSDSGGGAGIQADLLTFNTVRLPTTTEIPICHGCSVITAVTAQSSVSVDGIFTLPATQVQQQITTLKNDLPPQAIKLGMIASSANIAMISQFLQDSPAFVVCDPVMIASCGDALGSTDLVTAYQEQLFQYVDVITPNIHEATVLTGTAITDPESVCEAAEQLIAMGNKSVLIKGGHLQNTHYCADYWTDGVSSFWLTTPRINHIHSHGSGCTLSAALAAYLAVGFCLSDALVLAKMAVQQGIRLATALGCGPGAVAHSSVLACCHDLPALTQSWPEQSYRPFPSIHPENLKIYPIVKTLDQLKFILENGIKCIQWRVKAASRSDNYYATLQNAIILAKQYHAKLFINDDWLSAIRYRAHGVHLGQEDLDTADLTAIAQAGLYCGLSAHNATEIARAHAYQPSYVSLGPVFGSHSKDLHHPMLGLTALHYWQSVIARPCVAIGGINMTNAAQVMATGVDGVAFIEAVNDAPQLQALLGNTEVSC